MKIISWNVNGIRAGGRKGLLAKLESLNADVICFQETKATEEQVAEVLFGSGYHVEAYAAEKKATVAQPSSVKWHPCRWLGVWLWRSMTMRVD